MAIAWEEGYQSGLERGVTIDLAHPDHKFPRNPYTEKRVSERYPQGFEERDDFFKCEEDTVLKSIRFDRGLVAPSLKVEWDVEDINFVISSFGMKAEAFLPEDLGRRLGKWLVEHTHEPEGESR